jgi:L-glyceraldehyde 3-phosphate reductase
MYLPSDQRYAHARDLYTRCGKSGVLLPKVSLGLWHNFGGEDPFERSRAITRYAFDNGITHFDLANNYGVPAGSAEQTMGKLLKEDFAPFRDELFISSKAGYWMWDGPYGEWGSRKYLLSSLDQSLKRMGLDYVDLFYSHRFDPNTPIEETLQALVDAVKMGKALYVGISNWPLEPLRQAITYLKEHDTPLLIYQGRLNMLDREPIEEGILNLCQAEGIGFIAYSPLAQGLLTDRYLQGIPTDSRMAKEHFLKSERRTPEMLAYLQQLQAQAATHGRTIAQEALSWVLDQQGVTSVLVGASSVAQLKNNLETLNLQ